MADMTPVQWAQMALAIPGALAFGWSVLQVQGDAEARNLPHRLILILVMLTWPVGVAIYLLARASRPVSRGAP